jgi:hypothetical protein
MYHFFIFGKNNNFLEVCQQKTERCPRTQQKHFRHSEQGTESNKYNQLKFGIPQRELSRKEQR